MGHAIIYTQQNKWLLDWKDAHVSRVFWYSSSDCGGALPYFMNLLFTPGFSIFAQPDTSAQPCLSKLPTGRSNSRNPNFPGSLKKLFSRTTDWGVRNCSQDLPNCEAGDLFLWRSHTGFIHLACALAKRFQNLLCNHDNIRDRSGASQRQTTNDERGFARCNSSSWPVS